MALAARLTSCYALGIMRDYIESKVADGRKTVGELQRKLLTAEAELRAYEDMLAHLPAAEAGPRASAPNGSRFVGLDRAIERGSAIPSEMTAGWRAVLIQVGGRGQSFNAADIAIAASEQNVPAKMTNARSQLYQWQKKKMVVRVRKGQYRLTPKGTEAIKNIESSEAGASELSAKSGREGEFSSRASPNT